MKKAKLFFSILKRHNTEKPFTDTLYIQNWGSSVCLDGYINAKEIEAVLKEYMEKVKNE